VKPRLAWNRRGSTAEADSMSTEGSCEVVEVEPGRFQARLPPARRRRHASHACQGHKHAAATE
jgi:hypothetical protein